MTNSELSKRSSRAQHILLSDSIKAPQRRGGEGGGGRVGGERGGRSEGGGGSGVIDKVRGD